jgi:hypothetical protein
MSKHLGHENESDLPLNHLLTLRLFMTSFGCCAHCVLSDSVQLRQARPFGRVQAQNESCYDLAFKLSEACEEFEDSLLRGQSKQSMRDEEATVEKPETTRGGCGHDDPALAACQSALYINYC